MARTSTVSTVDMRVRRVDVFDDAQCAAAFRVELASGLVDRPWDDHDGYEQSVADWRYDDPAEPMEMYAAVRDGVVVGVGTLWLSQNDNTDKAWMRVNVDPAHRRLGVGTALVRTLERRLAQEGRHELLVETFVPPEATGQHPYERFAAAAGFLLETTGRIRLLDLPVPDRTLDALEAAARPHWAGAYRLETHVDGLPDELVDGYCRVSNQLGVDAPSGAVHFEEESLTPERYRGYLELERSQGRTRLTTVAVQESSGDVVAYTDLVLPAGAPTKVWQWGTLVERAHRGHRLGIAVKVANLRRLQRDHPERTTVGTGNDETNSWMVDINVKLGYRVVELCRMYRKVLPR